MPLILGTNSIKDTGYNVANSCIFDGSSSYMHKTPGSAGNTKLWTWSAWFKKCPTGADLGVFGQYIDANNYFRIKFRDDDRLQVDQYTSGSHVMNFILTQQLRDVSAWYHLVVAYDSAQGTDSNRVKIFINGTRVTAFNTETYPNQNVVTTLPVDGTPIELGRTTDSQFFNGYFAEVVLVDGSALAPTSFGEFDEDSPTIWKPINVSGLTFGTNGFYLDFEASANLGNDANGGTDLTEVNLATTDQSTDTCTNNFATFNPLDNHFLDATFSEGNLKVAIDNGSDEAFTTSTIGVSSGKWYMENKIITISNGRLYSGVVYGTAQATNDWPGGGSDQWFYRTPDGKVYHGGSEEYTGATLADDDIVGIALDLDNHKLYFSKNGAFQNSGDPTSGSTGTGAIALDTGQTYFFAVGESGSTAVVSSANFGSPSFAISSGNTDGNGYGNFEYAVPSGYFALNTKNLAEYG